MRKLLCIFEISQNDVILPVLDFVSPIANENLYIKLSIKNGMENIHIEL